MVSNKMSQRRYLKLYQIQWPLERSLTLRSKKNLTNNYLMLDQLFSQMCPTLSQLSPSQLPRPRKRKRTQTWLSWPLGLHNNLDIVNVTSVICDQRSSLDIFYIMLHNYYYMYLQGD